RSFSRFGSDDSTPVVRHFFSVVDAYKGYWQFPLDEESQEMFSFATHEGVFTPTRIMQGVKDSVVAFQSGMEEAQADLLYKQLLILIDDGLLYTKDFEAHLIALRKFLENSQRCNIKLNPKK